MSATQVSERRQSGLADLAVDAAKGAGVMAGGLAADGARMAAKGAVAKVAATKGAVAAKGAALAGAKGAGAALAAAKLSPVVLAAASPLGFALLPIAAAVGAGYLARRALKRLG